MRRATDTWQRIVTAFLMLSALGPVACTGSPATLALRPDFEVATSTGLVSVSIREPLPGLTFAESGQLVKTGMQSVMPISADAASLTPPFPLRRIVWHVEPTPDPGTSRLSVNIFVGSVPVAIAQDIVAHGTPRAAMTYAIAAMTRRLITEYAERDVQDAANGAPDNGSNVRGS